MNTVACSASHCTVLLQKTTLFSYNQIDVQKMVSECVLQVSVNLGS
jgi:hypothetical protein